MRESISLAKPLFAPFVTNPLINFTTMGLILLSGLGFSRLVGSYGAGAGACEGKTAP